MLTNSDFSAIELGSDVLNKVASPKIDDVVDSYEHAVLGYFPRGRYLAGANAKYMFWPMMLMPEWMSDMVFTMNPNAPVPKSCQK